MFADYECSRVLASNVYTVAVDEILLNKNGGIGGLSQNCCNDPITEKKETEQTQNTDGERHVDL